MILSMKTFPAAPLATSSLFEIQDDSRSFFFSMELPKKALLSDNPSDAVRQDATSESDPLRFQLARPVRLGNGARHERTDRRNGGDRQKDDPVGVIETRCERGSRRIG